MSNKSELIIAAIILALENQGIDVKRNSAIPETIDEAAGLVIVRDGNPGEPDRLLGGFENCYYRHGIDLEIFVVNGNQVQRDQYYDDLITKIKTALFADKTFGGLAYGFDVSLPSPESVPNEGSDAIKSANIELYVEYETPTPLG